MLDMEVFKQYMNESEGFNRHNGIEFTVVEEGAFLGCNSTLVAPVNVGKGAYVAAGTVVTEDVPPNALAIARPREQHKKEWALRNKRADS